MNNIRNLYLNEAERLTANFLGIAIDTSNPVPKDRWKQLKKIWEANKLRFRSGDVFTAALRKLVIPTYSIVCPPDEANLIDTITDALLADPELLKACTTKHMSREEIIRSTITKFYGTPSWHAFYSDIFTDFLISRGYLMLITQLESLDNVPEESLDDRSKGHYILLKNYINALQKLLPEIKGQTESVVFNENYVSSLLNERYGFNNATNPKQASMIISFAARGLWWQELILKIEDQSFSIYHALFPQDEEDQAIAVLKEIDIYYRESAWKLDERSKIHDTDFYKFMNEIAEHNKEAKRAVFDFEMGV